jgi:hypothetical protein
MEKGLSWGQCKGSWSRRHDDNTQPHPSQPSSELKECRKPCNLSFQDAMTCELVMAVVWAKQGCPAADEDTPTTQTHTQPYLNQASLHGGTPINTQLCRLAEVANLQHTMTRRDVRDASVRMITS